MLAEKKRIEYIDLAKGICIILVVVSHMMDYYRLSYPYDFALKSFRMPLYFFLSGVFFKSYENIGGFLRRKTNKLLIPFAFFYVVISIIVPIVLKNYCGITLLSVRYWNHLPMAFAQVFTLEKFPNPAIWFLLCLFEVNVMFYIIYLLSRVLRRVSVAVIVLGSALCGAVGITLSVQQINLPIYLDTSLTAIPFFGLGYLLNRHTNVLRQWRGDRYLWVLVAVFAFLVWYLSYPLDYRSNYFKGAYLIAYPCGILGTLAVIFLAKKIKRLPLITYYGRYSIMILCTHQIFYQLLYEVIHPLKLQKWAEMPLNFAIVMLAYVAVIPFMRRFMPHVTAQKDVIR